MLRSLPFVSVRQQQREPRHAAPFRFRARQELVDVDLGDVAEVPELRLPDHQRARVGGAVTVLESEHGGLAQHGVDHLEPALGGIEMLERNVAAAVLLIVQYRMAVAEGAAARVLPR